MGTTKTVSWTFASKSRPNYGVDSLMCAIFARQRPQTVTRSPQTTKQVAVAFHMGTDVSFGFGETLNYEPHPTSNHHHPTTNFGQNQKKNQRQKKTKTRMSTRKMWSRLPRLSSSAQTSRSAQPTSSPAWYPFTHTAGYLGVYTQFGPKVRYFIGRTPRMFLRYVLGSVLWIIHFWVVEEFLCSPLCGLRPGTSYQTMKFKLP